MPKPINKIAPAHLKQDNEKLLIVLFSFKKKKNNLLLLKILA